MSKYPLTDKVIAITGASGGFGDALCKALYQRGAKLALFDIDHTALAAQLEYYPDTLRAKTWHANVCDVDSLRSAMNSAAEYFGHIDVVIANAGVDLIEPLSAEGGDNFERVIDINLNGVWRTFRAALPHVKASRGYLFAVSSMAAFVHSPLQASYTASKAGVWALCNSVRLEVRQHGVDVGTLHPTFFKTPLLDNISDNAAGSALWGSHQKFPFKTVGLDDVVAAAVNAIESRAEIVTVPRVNRLIANAPGLLRKFIESIGFKDENVRKAMAFANKK
ncbi:SDR family NAD(P)-dependent oxidoreductase [Zhongshania aliphaticivorans]|uniref:SDR family NAD(P)-dependent oxidoreductase n=1 Tax=Zhongshania aliphaticivorans TaxID=1470434 RepID=UPI0012E46239|nr:SDR family NAD(P)-dependent oxidoreductase [Zhongshania aliphaticivorans]MBQ0759361.1 SDR family NAD(P)-dependent oxidoreductase [Zhongshania sp.]MBU0537170.1 SDR family NAD(P)-dependent oxidoreductase [Gammaproteobacteria bacterium]MBU1833567.1 SDR family NAD(P)-dependent oxidoreductase [Gammaproteobacteria bacterium]CAA0115878.1 (-)-trans-carveol dehydrogenase [Zhongshania aliphaticivorans]